MTQMIYMIAVFVAGVAAGAAWGIAAAAAARERGLLGARERGERTDAEGGGAAAKEGDAERERERFIRQYANMLSYDGSERGQSKIEDND